MPKILRLNGPFAHDFHCRDQNCEWPKYSGTVRRSIEESMEHIRQTGHEVLFAVSERCTIMPDDASVIALSAEEWTRRRGMSTSDLTDLDI